jgi:hypothetical protein
MLLFNFCGYRFFASWLENKSDAQFEAQLDNNNFDESQLISIKIPATHYAYYTNSKSFERVDGKIEMNGVAYKFVKRRLYKDSLELLCIPDYNTVRLQTAREDFFKLVNDLQHNGQGKKAGSHTPSKNFAPDFCSSNYNPLVADLSTAHLKQLSEYRYYLSSAYILFRGQPPKIS